jgi:phage shock protein PspC (stress-responsive transcriptional regulator)
MKNQFFEANQSLQREILFEINRGMFFCETILKHLSHQWGISLSTFITSSLFVLFVILIVFMAVLFVLYVYFIEKLLLSRLSSKYKEFRQFFKLFMPEFIIVKEKRIKFWLIKNNVLEK